MIFIAILVFGIYSLVNLPIDLYPEIELPAISVLTSYGGANASDIETNITRPIENSLNSANLAITGLKTGLTAELVSIDIKEAVGCLGEILGISTGEDILGEIFRRFCIGK